MSDECFTQDECIKIDKEALKNELSSLTNVERRLIIKMYKAKVKEYGIGIKEYSEFMKFFDELED